MCAVQWGTKACLLILYWRLTQNLKQNMVVKAAAVYVAVTYVLMEILYFGVWCRPFRDYWTTPTNNSQCTTALNHLITNLVFNLTSDILIMSIPLPLFLKAHLDFKKKVLLVFPFSLGLFTMLCAILSKRSSFVHPYSAEWVYWYCRESSTAMIVTNMPYSWALVRKVFKLRSFFGDSTAGRSRSQGLSPREIYGSNTGVITLCSGPATPSSQLEVPSRKPTWPTFKRDKPNVPEKDPRKDSKIDRSTTSSSHSATEEIPNPSQSQPTRTEWTLDRLYPLDDEEIGTVDVTQRRYEG
jgi:hypothetical protein